MPTAAAAKLLQSCPTPETCATLETAAHQAPHPWDSPGKNTGVRCHFLLQYLTPLFLLATQFCVAPVLFNHSAYNWVQIKFHLQNVHDNASLNVHLLQKGNL